MTHDHPAYPYKLPALLAAAQDLIEHAENAIEALAEASPEHDEALTELVLAISNARMAWAAQHDTTEPQQ